MGSSRWRRATGERAAWWTAAPVPGDNGNHVYLRSAGGLCLTNGSLAGEGGAVTLSACDAGYWTQQWKPLGAQTDVSGAPDAPWLGHTRSCDDSGVVNGTCDANGRGSRRRARARRSCRCAGSPRPPASAASGPAVLRLGTSCLPARLHADRRHHAPRVHDGLDKINQPVAAIDDTYTDSS
jgi:hypothetical protein